MMSRGFSRAKPLRSIWYVLLVIPVLAMTACVDRGASLGLATTGAATAKTLATYYESLIQDTVDSSEILAFNIGFITPGNTEESQLALLQAQQEQARVQTEALNHRLQLARNLAAAYEALQRLSSYDASAEVKNAADNLAKVLKSMPQLPGGKSDPSGIFGSVASDLLAWKQSQDIAEAAKLIMKTLEGITTMFGQETNDYNSIVAERGKHMQNALKFLLDKKLVTAKPLLQRTVESVGLAMVSPEKPVDDLNAASAFRLLVQVRLQRLALASEGATDGVSRALSSLLASHRQLLNGQPVGLDQILTWLGKAQSYLDEISKLRTGNQVPKG